jgi:hypothetical protein
MAICVTISVKLKCPAVQVICRLKQVPYKLAFVPNPSISVTKKTTTTRGSEKEYVF